MDANLTIVMTYKGLKALGLPQSSLDSFPENFKAGMAGRSDILGDKGDNDPSNWLAPFGDKGDIHICGAVIANSQEKWQAKLAELKQTFAPYLDTSRNAIEILVEHDFGVDGDVKTCLVIAMASVTQKLMAVVSALKITPNVRLRRVNLC